MMIEASQFIKKAAEKGGFTRESFNEAQIPTTISNITILPFFGDLKSTFVLSSLLLRRYREELKPSKYFILCSWPGHRALYPYVDEYWSVNDSHLQEFYAKSYNFRNHADLAVLYQRKLNQFFDEVVDISEFEEFYDNGIQAPFAHKFQTIKRNLPLISSSGVLGNDFNRKLANAPGYKLVVYPSVVMKAWRQNKLETIKTKEEFWVALVTRLLDEGYAPVIVQDYGSFDLSKHFAQKCIYLANQDVSRVLCLMRACDCVLDLFSDFSRLAVAARAPFVAFTERTKYVNSKEYELDDLCCVEDLPRQYVFSFTTIIDGGTSHSWNVNVFDALVSRLKTFLPEINRDQLPTGSGIYEEVSYSKVRKRKIKRLGTRFIKVEQD
jgi:hypothetical protein